MIAARDREWSAPRPLMEEWTCQTEGRCRQLAPDVFFPEDSGRSGLRAREEQAKKICRDCPVLTRCRDHALAMRETHRDAHRRCGGVTWGCATMPE